MISNRQSSRRRGRGGSQRPSGGSSQGQRDSGNRIDSRTRGNAAQLLEKYRNMARDAQMSGDRVNTEYYLQFADHYFRVLSDSRARQDDHRPVRPVDDFDAMDEEYGDEGEPIRTGEQGFDTRSNGSDNRSDRSDGNRSDGNRTDGNRQNGRDYQSRDDRQPREERQPRDERQPREERASRDERSSRDDRARDERPRRDSRDQQNGQRDAQPRAEAPRQREAEQGVEAPVNGAAYSGGPANDIDVTPAQAKPERKPRTSRSRSPAPAPEMEVASMDEDRLPPSLGIISEAVAESEGDAELKPKRRRSSRSTTPASEAQAG